MSALASPPPVVLPPAPPASMLDGLRAVTRPLHDRCERAVDLSASTRTLADYARLLAVSETFQSRLEHALGDITAVAPTDLVAGRRARLARVRADLRALGREPSPTVGRSDRFDGSGRQLGAWYVLEGSALGGIVIAREVRRALPEAAAATSCFAGEGRATMARWRRFRAFLEACASPAGATDGPVCLTDLRAGADAAFGMFIDIARGG